MVDGAIGGTKSVIKGISVTYNFDGVNYGERARALGIDPKSVDWVDTHNNYTTLLETYIHEHCDYSEAWVNVEMLGAEDDCVRVYFDQECALTFREKQAIQTYAEMLVSDAHVHASTHNYVVEMKQEEV